MKPSSYPSDLTDDQWQLIASLLPSAKPGGRPRSVELRAVVNAILYILVTGCPWRYLPSSYPKWKTVYHYFATWRDDGTWPQVHERLRVWTRVGVHQRQASSSLAIVDSQSVPSAPMVAEKVGYDGGKKVKGRKRHVMVDSLGLLMVVVVTAANVADGEGLKQLVPKAKRLWVNLTRLVKVVVDGGYRGQELADWLMRQGPWFLEVVMRSSQTKGFKLLPQRWVVERTFGWLRWSRRLNRDYELKPSSSEAWIYLASIRIMLRRLA